MFSSDQEEKVSEVRFHSKPVTLVIYLITSWIARRRKFEEEEKRENEKKGLKEPK